MTHYAIFQTVSAVLGFVSPGVLEERVTGRAPDMAVKGSRHEMLENL